MHNNVSAAKGQVSIGRLIFNAPFACRDGRFSLLDNVDGFGQAQSMEQINSIPEPPAEVTRPAMSLSARLFNVFTEPGEVFEYVKNSKPSMDNWLVPVLLAALTGALAIFVLFSQPAILQKIHEQQMKAFDDQVKAGKMTQAQADQAEAMVEKFAGPTMMKISGSISAVIFSFVQVFWWALVLWLLGLIFLKVKFPYIKALEVAGLATMISILGAVITVLLAVIMGKQTSISLAFFITDFDPKNLVHLLLKAVDLFSLWLAVVMAVGLARLAGARFSKALLCTFIYWTAFQLFLITIGFVAVHLSPGAK